MSASRIRSFSHKYCPCLSHPGSHPVYKHDKYSRNMALKLITATVKSLWELKLHYRITISNRRYFFLCKLEDIRLHLTIKQNSKGRKIAGNTATSSGADPEIFQRGGVEEENVCLYTFVFYFLLCFITLFWKGGCDPVYPL